MARCKSPQCLAEIAWATTVPGGKAMPVNSGSAGDQAGTLAVWRANGQLLCRVLGQGEEPGPGEYRGVAHWSTCPAAKSHKRASAQRSGDPA